jgi:hypothetical protein
MVDLQYALQAGRQCRKGRPPVRVMLPAVQHHHVPDHHYYCPVDPYYVYVTEYYQKQVIFKRQTFGLFGLSSLSYVLPADSCFCGHPPKGLPTPLFTARVQQMTRLTQRPLQNRFIYLYRMRSSLVVRASDCQCTSCNGPGFDPSIRQHSGF